jgi:hypothetical protein
MDVQSFVFHSINIPLFHSIKQLYQFTLKSNCNAVRYDAKLYIIKHLEFQMQDFMILQVLHCNMGISHAQPHSHSETH